MQTAHSFTQFGFFPYRIEQEISKGQNPTIIVSVYDKGNKKKNRGHNESYEKYHDSEHVMKNT